MSSAFAGDPETGAAAEDGGRSDRLRLEVGEVGAECVVDLAGDVALEAADDLGLGPAFGGTACGIVAGALAVAQPADSDEMQCPVGLAVATRVEAVTAVLPEEAGIGLAAQIAANGAAPRNRSMFWPAVTSGWPAWPVETPSSWTVRGAAVATSCCSC